MKKFLKLLFSRITIVVLLMVLQLTIIMVAVVRFSTYFVYIYTLFFFLSIVVVLWIVNKKENPAYKLAWVIPILLFPVFGGLFYLIFGNQMGSMRKRMNGVNGIIKASLSEQPGVSGQIRQKDPQAYRQAQYLYWKGGYPVYQNTVSEYLTPGEKKFERLKEELEKAQEYIFLEYFIIEDGVMWGAVLDILKRKAALGVDVRLIYDDIGSLMTLPYRYDEELEKFGIHCKVFNPFIPVLSVRLNNRDHRKIVVIDGHTAFTGGINLADEYINRYPKHGYWKDASIMLKGDAVWSFTVMFLTMWDYLCGTHEDFAKYHPHSVKTETFPSDGYVLPYGDSPLDGETIGEMVYLNMIHRAAQYLYICTPYLIVDNEIVTALSLAAKSGVDVRIITPYIGDKWYVHTVTRANYQQLVEDGVRIYEYIPGFIHSKTFCCDDELGVVGSINLDYRSLYLHFECAVWLYQCSTIQDIKQDFFETLEQCREITAEDCRKVKWYTKLFRSVIRLFAPLM